MNPATLSAHAVVRTLVEHRVRDVVLCPGSRSAPLAYALHAVEQAGHLRLHVRIDERSAAYLALGLAKAALLDGPAMAAVVTTSGTAVANLHPAVLEARHGGVPLLVITADRPHSMRGTWANQTTHLQARIFGDAVLTSLDLPVAGGPDEVAAWRSAAVLVLDLARGASTGERAGPVHLNLAFAEPLVPDDGDRSPGRGRTAVLAWPVDDGPRRGAPAPVLPAARPAGPVVRLAPGLRTLVLAGDQVPGGGGPCGRHADGPSARRLAERAGWPLAAEPSSGARGGPNAVGPYRLLLDHPDLGGRVERVVAFGRPTLSRPVARLLDRPEVEVVVVSPGAGWPGPGRACLRAGKVLAPARWDAERAGESGDWLREWLVASAAATDAIDGVLDGEPRPTGMLVAREVATAATARPRHLLLAGASNAIRDLDLAAHVPRRGTTAVLANRGLSGIDGMLATAVGASLGTGRPATLLAGDLTFLHDLNALVIGPLERRPSLRVVVVNDDGGGIFGVLDQGAPALAASFDRLFGTPHGSDLAALCRGVGARHAAASDGHGLRAALAVPPGVGRVEVLEVRVDRAGQRAFAERVAAVVRLAVDRGR